MAKDKLVNPAAALGEATRFADLRQRQIHSVIHKVERQLRKHKEKLTGHRATGIKRIESQIEPQADAE